MNLGLVDAFIVLFLAMGAIVGFKSGVIKESTRFIGLFVVILISFMMKDALMVLFYENLPFFDFFGVIKGIDAINILFYQLISFLVIFAALMFVLRVLIVITGIVEWLLKMTIFLSLPSKILGAVVGLLEYYVYIFIVLYVLNMPVFNLTFVSDSMFGGKILDDTPILSGLVDDTVEVYSDVWKVLQNRENRSNKEVNTLVLATLLDHDLIEIESARKLVESNKIIIEDPSILNNYQDDDDFFEKLGGCALIGGCYDEDSEEFEITKVGDVFQFGGISGSIINIEDLTCDENNKCSKRQKLKVGVSVQSIAGNRNYELFTNGDFQVIDGTNVYMYVKQVDGILKIVLYEQ